MMKHGMWAWGIGAVLAFFVPVAASADLVDCAAYVQETYKSAGFAVTGSCQPTVQCKAPLLKDEGTAMVSDCKNAGETCCSDYPSAASKANGGKQAGAAKDGGQGSSMVLGNPLGANATLYSIMERIVRMILGLAGSVAFLVFIYAGGLWMLARENAAQVKKAQDAMRSAVIGIFLIVFAYTITSFVINVLTVKIASPQEQFQPPTADDAQNP